ncbi:MAG: hypothetical protein H6828_10435 [Planctomycetes bacterium]|nr:hypothetical protein [Planctomycetota bacterium]
MGAGDGKFVLGLLLGALVGAGGLYWLNGATGQAAASAPALERETAPAAVSAPSAAAPELTRTASREERNQAASDDAGEVEVSDTEVARLVAQTHVEPAAVTRGEGTVTGVVLDADGRGVGGVLVRASEDRSRSYTRAADSFSGAPPVDRSVEDVVKSAVTSHLRTRAERVEARSDAAGNFTLAQLGDGTWSVNAYKEGFRLERVGESRSVRAGDRVEYTATPVVAVPVRVLAVGGAPAAKAFVVCDGGDRSSRWSLRWSAEEPTLWLPAGDYELTAFSSDGNGDSDREDNDAREASQTETLALPAGAQPGEVVLTLAPRSGVRGRLLTSGLLSSDDRPTAKLMELAAGAEPNLEALADSNKSSNSWRDDSYHFYDLEPGRYVVGAARSSWSAPIVAHEVFEVTDGVLELNLTLPEADRSQMLVVHVQGPDGRPLDGVDFMFEYHKGFGGGSRGVQAVQDRQKDWLLELPEEFREDWLAGKATTGTYGLQVEHDRYGTRTVELTPGQLDVSVRFEEPASLVVDVPGYVGSAYVGRVLVQCTNKGSRSTWFNSDDGGRVNAAGSATFDKLAPGEYSLALMIEQDDAGGWRPQQRVAGTDFKVGPGENHATLAIPPLHVLVVHYADAKSGANLALRPLDRDETDPWGRSGAEFGDDGLARFECVPAGDYELMFWGGAPKKMRVSVPCGQVEFTPMRLDALLVTITDEGGDLAKAGFRAGDLVIGVNGAEFEGEPGNPWGELYSSKTAELTYIVLRGGKRLEVTLRGADVGDWSTMGGTLEPTAR